MKNCSNCQKEFNDTKHPNRKFCSQECFGLSKRNGPMQKECEYCGTEYKRRSWKSRFCSKACSNRFNADKDDHWNFNITPEIHEMIEGILLSDGCLEMLETNRYPRFVLTQGTGHKEYCEYVAKKLGFQKEDVKSRMVFNKKSNKEFEINSITTGSSPLWVNYYNRWYKNGKKIIPEDFKITPTSLFHTYIGDGSLSITEHINKKGYNQKDRKLCFYLMDFDHEVISNIFIKQLEFAGMNFNIQLRKQKGYNRLYPVVSTSQKQTIINVIKYMLKNDISCYDYKFDLSRI